MKLPQEVKRRQTGIAQGVPKRDTGTVASKADGLFQANGADRCHQLEVYPDFIVGGERLCVPRAGPDLAVVGIRLSVEGRRLVVGKQLIPAAAPNIVVAGIHRQASGRHARIVPEQIRVRRFMRDLPDFGACFGQDHDAKVAIFQD